MSAEEPQSGPLAIGPQWTRWALLLLVVSLAANLLIAGALFSGYFRQQRAERMSGPSYTEILPRRFIQDLGDERRRELGDVLGKYRKTFRDDRRSLREAALDAADALTAEPYDASKARAAVEAYGERSRGLVDLGIKAANEVIDKLKPEERKVLADRIRTRAMPSGKRKPPE